MIKQIAEAIREKRHYNRELLLEEMPDEIRKIGEGSCWTHHRFTGDGSNSVTFTGITSQPTHFVVSLRGQMKLDNEVDSGRFLLWAGNYEDGTTEDRIYFYVDASVCKPYRAKIPWYWSAPITASYNASNKTCTLTLSDSMTFRNGNIYMATFTYH